MPFGELRRKDRAMTPDESDECLERALVGRLGTVGPEGMPYIVPMSFVYDPTRRVLYFHCGATGHRMDNLEYSPMACFEVDEPGELIPTGPTPCNTGQLYSSVISFGRSEIVTDPDEKERIMRLFVGKYVDRLMPDRRYDPEMRMLDTTTVIALRVEKMTGKQRRPA